MSAKRVRTRRAEFTGLTGQFGQCPDATRLVSGFSGNIGGGGDKINHRNQ